MLLPFNLIAFQVVLYIHEPPLKQLKGVVVLSSYVAACINIPMSEIISANTTDPKYPNPAIM